MRRKAHHLMYPGKPYVDDSSPPALQRGGSLRQPPRGIMQFMPSNYNWTLRSPNGPRPGLGTIEQMQKMKLPAKMSASQAAKLSAPQAAKMSAPQAAKMSAPQAAKMPAPQAVKMSAPKAEIPGRPVNAAMEPYKPYVRPAGQYAMQVGRPYGAGLRYEPSNPVKDAIHKYDRM